MDLRRLDSQGLTVCPVCEKHYKPVLEPRTKDDQRVIQKIYPDAQPWEREQLLSGVCSDACWKKL